MSSPAGYPYQSRRHRGQVTHAFGGFPYLVTRITTGYHHIVVLPALSEAELVPWGRVQYCANQLPTTVVLGWDRCIVFEDDADGVVSNRIPHGLVTVTGRIRTLHRNLGDRDLRDRMHALFLFVARRGTPPNPDQVCYPDRMEILREPSGTELRELQGWGADGTPAGLVYCPSCDDYRGECLDTREGYEGLVARVRCRCENNTCCVACGAPFAEVRLRSGVYDPLNGCVLHVTAWSALAHKCPAIHS